MSDKDPILFYFSARSPFVYIAIHRLLRSPEFASYNFELRAINPMNLSSFSNPTDYPAKTAYIMLDAARQAEEANLPIAQKYLQFAKMMETTIKQGASTSRSVSRKEDWLTPAMCHAYASKFNKEWEFAETICQRHWGVGESGGRQIVWEHSVLESVANDIGLDGKEMIHSLKFDNTLKEMVERWTKEANDSLVFGFPMFVYKGERFWGNDRLPFLLKRLRGDEMMPRITVGDAAVVRRRSGSKL